jgi:hypothetical protein
MMYPVVTTVGAQIYIQTEQIISMTFSTLTVLMSDGTTHVVTAAQFADLLQIINANHG